MRKYRQRTYSAKQQREMTKFEVSWRTWAHDRKFSFLCIKVRRSNQFRYWIVRPHCTSWTNSNNREEVKATRTYVFKRRFRWRCRRGFLKFWVYSIWIVCTLKVQRVCGLTRHLRYLSVKCVPHLFCHLVNLQVDWFLPLLHLCCRHLVRFPLQTFHLVAAQGRYNLNHRSLQELHNHHCFYQFHGNSARKNTHRKSQSSLKYLTNSPRQTQTKWKLAGKGGWGLLYAS